MSRTRFLQRRWIALSILMILLLAWWATAHVGVKPWYRVGEEVDRLNGVAVFYNGDVGHTAGRNLSPDGYNLGLKYQCVEFVKRYYYQHLGHKMPDSYGHAKDFFEPALADGAINTRRNLLQFSNGSRSKPRPDDLIVFGATPLNRYGHVAIVSEVTEAELEIVQQNPGRFGSSRERLGLVSEEGRWRCENGRVLGWLRKVSKQGRKRAKSSRTTQQTTQPSEIAGSRR